MVNLDVIIALDSMMCISGLDKHELHYIEKNPQ